MNGQQRMRAALRYLPVDRAPLQYYYTPVGFYEHGEKLHELFAALPGDCEPFVRHPIPRPAARDFDAEGNFHTLARDEWGTLWEKRIFGVTGIPREYPLASWEDYAGYTLPPLPAFDAEKARQAVAVHRQNYYALWGIGSLLETLKALRPDEEVLCDIALNDPRLHDLADRIVSRNSELLQRAIVAGVDGIAFGDDYGTERGLLIGPDMWRHFVKPRLRELFRPAVRAGLDIVFHSCGKIGPILEDLREVGATAIWPQLPAYDMPQLAQRCRELGLAVAIHTDRAKVMTRGTPSQVRELVQREYDTFRVPEGGAWFYVEVDNGFPLANIEALLNAIAQWR